MNKLFIFVAGSILSSPQLVMSATSQTKIDSTKQYTSQNQPFQQQLDELQRNYDRRLSRIEKRLQQTQKATRTKKANSFNPGISLILNGNYAAYNNHPDNYQLPGFTLNNDAGLTPEGFSLNESEVTLGANVDQLFYGQATFSLSDNAGVTSIDTEEAYFETLSLGNGLIIKAGRFFSAIGYINDKHAHTWDFADAPLIYRGLFGDQLKQDGVHLSWILPIERYFLLGAEAGNGVHYPASGNHTGIGDWLLYLKTGGDIGLSHSWQLGLSHWQANNVKNRFSQGLNSPVFNGNSQINAFDFVYKWAHQGNAQQQNLKLQVEFFHRKEQGEMRLNDTAQSSRYDGSQNGWYAQAVYQFEPQWQGGFRYDHLNSNNTGSNATVLSQAGLLNNGLSPQRSSIMLAWLPSEFSRLRLQFNRDESGPQPDNQFFLQYTMVMGAHSAHAY